MHGGLHHLHIAGRQLAQGIGGIHQALQAGGADHQAPAGHQRFPYRQQHITQGPSHLQQHPIWVGGQLVQIIGRSASVNVQVADAKTASVLLQQLDGIGVALEGMHRTPGHQPGDFQGQGTGAAAHIPHQGIGAGAQMGQQHHPQLHGGGAEARSVFKGTIRQPRGDEIPLVGRLLGSLAWIGRGTGIHRPPIRPQPSPYQRSGLAKGAAAAAAK